MNDSKLKPFADLKYKARTYKDKDGNEKGVWLTVGTLFSTPHGSHMSIKMDSMPVGEWNGWLSVYEREDALERQDSRPMPTSTVMDEAYKDKLPNDSEADKPIDLTEIPF